MSTIEQSFCLKNEKTAGSLSNFLEPVGQPPKTNLNLKYARMRSSRYDQL